MRRQPEPDSCCTDGTQFRTKTHLQRKSQTCLWATWESWICIHNGNTRVSDIPTDSSASVPALSQDPCPKIRAVRRASEGRGDLFQEPRPGGERHWSGFNAERCIWPKQLLQMLVSRMGTSTTELSWIRWEVTGSWSSSHRFVTQLRAAMSWEEPELFSWTLHHPDVFDHLSVWSQNENLQPTTSDHSVPL